MGIIKLNARSADLGHQITVLKCKEKLSTDEEKKLKNLEAEKARVDAEIKKDLQGLFNPKTGLEVEKGKKEPKVERSEADTPRNTFDEFEEALKAAKLDDKFGLGAYENLKEMKKSTEGGEQLRTAPDPKKEETPKDDALRDQFGQMIKRGIDESDPYKELPPLQKTELKSIDKEEKKELKKVEPKFE